MAEDDTALNIYIFLAFGHSSFQSLKFKNCSIYVLLLWHIKTSTMKNIHLILFMQKIVVYQRQSGAITLYDSVMLHTLRASRSDRSGVVYSAVFSFCRRSRGPPQGPQGIARVPFLHMPADL